MSIKYTCDICGESIAKLPAHVHVFAIVKKRIDIVINGFFLKDDGSLTDRPAHFHRSCLLDVLSAWDET